jgi:hypothetical protein
MKIFIATGVAVLLLIVSCKNQQSVKAKIFERKEVEGNRLLIGYKYVFDNKEYIDSAIITNVVVESDSISVMVNPKSPAKSTPEIEQ